MKPGGSASEIRPKASDGRMYSGITSFYFPPVFQTQREWGLVGMQCDWEMTQKWHPEGIKYVYRENSMSGLVPPMVHHQYQLVKYGE